MLEHYDVGVLALRGDEHASKSWKPTLDWLEEHIPNTTFDLHTYDFDELEDAFQHNQLDFLLTSPGQATKIAREYPLNWLATQKTPYSDNQTHSIASVAVVRSDSPYKSLNDIEYARVGAVSKKAFGGFLALRYELESRDLVGSSFFSRVHFFGPPTDNIILSMLDGVLDVAVVPACTLESLIKEGRIERHTVRVLEGKRPHDSVCTVSTPLYPNWTFAKTDRASEDIGKRVTQALLSMPDNTVAAKAAGNVGWTLPASSVKVDKVLHHLELHPLQRTWQEGFWKWLDRNKGVAYATLVVFFLMNVYHFWLEYRFNRSKKALEKTIYELKEKSNLLEHAQRTMIVSELGSSIAHEINQPLSTIKNYSEGLERRIERGMTAEELKPVLGKIQQQVVVASGIIQRLRGLIKQTPTDYVTCDPVFFIRESIALVEYDFATQKIDLNLTIEGNPVKGEFDVIGMQQVMLNLLKNAKEACMASLDWELSPTVNIELLYGESEVVIRVQDNGIGLEASETEVKRPFYTTKSDGLGLGLPICREVVEAHRGHFIIQGARPVGCEVTVVLPITQEQK
ncbi:sensor histidine kinase [Enterovibrio sp. NIFS-20-8]|uniref:sensor histidine kinase n=1 Tax=Enterovibrio paralichthyis TaxID=2853805 RepID=UPI001C45380D|nr:sensor histidine kinase [Enterovibrio paralichthyis]